MGIAATWGRRGTTSCLLASDPLVLAAEAGVPRPGKASLQPSLWTRSWQRVSPYRLQRPFRKAIQGKTQVEVESPKGDRRSRAPLSALAWESNDVWSHHYQSWKRSPSGCVNLAISGIKPALSIMQASTVREHRGVRFVMNKSCIVTTRPLEIMTASNLERICHKDGRGA